MAWERVHTATFQKVTKAQIWNVWEDVAHWPLWDTDSEWTRMNEAFAVGSHFLLKPKGGPAVKICLVKVVRDKEFTDVTRFPFAKMYGIHAMRETPAGLEISHTVRMEGALTFLWRKLVGEKVVAGLEIQAQRMVERARSL